MSGIENFTFENSENRESLRAIKEVQRQAQKEVKKHISDTIIASLNSEEGLKIVRGDTLAHLNALTISGNRLEFNDDANHIMEGDIITIRDRLLYKNDVIVGSVSQGFEISTTKAIVSVRSEVENIIPTTQRRNNPERQKTFEGPRSDVEGNENHDGMILADYIAERGYPIWKSGAFCGQNVGNMLSQFGSPQLPSWGRHGYRWTGFLDRNPGFTKVRISSPMEAQPGGICVYDKGYGYTDERQNYGHVEIALGNGEFYYGHKRSHPGGSIDASRNPDNSGFTGYVYYPVTSKFDDMMMVA